MDVYSEIVHAVRDGFLSGKTRNLEFRKSQLKSLRKMYRDHEETFIHALAQDLGKPRLEACLSEIDFLMNDVNYILNRLEDWVKDEKVPLTLASFFDTAYVRHDPYGVVLILGAWNYPLQLTMAPVSGAIAAGNCTIIKPPEMATATASVIAKLVPEYLDQDCYRVICGGVPETTELLKERFDYIFYTGSPAVGRIIHAAANKYLTPVTLEMGGKCPVFIDDTVDMHLAAKRILWGKCSNAGQTCIAPDYLLCSKEVESEFVKHAKVILNEWYGKNRVGAPDMCKIISDKHVSRLSDYLEEGTLSLGGSYNKEECYLEPTILTDVPPDAKVLNEEIFGPILPVVTVNSVEEAISYVQSRNHPLASYIFTTNSDTRKAFTSQLQTGAVCVNDVMLHFVNHHLPFGGVGESGMGAYHGKASYDTFTHRKPCLVRNYNAIGESLGSKRFPPYSDSKLKAMRSLLLERRLPNFSFLGYPVAFGLGALTLYIIYVIIEASKSDG